MHNYEHIQWRFPIERTHCGVLLGNARMGAIVWGAGSTLKITLGRADFWDHRGGLEFDERVTYDNVCRLLSVNDEQALRALFTREHPAGQPRRPSLIPVGRVDLDLGPDARLEHAELSILTGELAVQAHVGGRLVGIHLDLQMEEPYLRVSFDREITGLRIVERPAWEHVGEYLESISFEPPSPIRGQPVRGWVQRRPNDPPLTVAHLARGTEIGITASCDPLETIVQELDDYLTENDKRQARNRQWWVSYWDRVPELSLPSDTLMFIYYYGLYKFAGLTNPAGVPATLQGPWIE